MATKAKQTQLQDELEKNITKAKKDDSALPSKQVIKSLSSPFAAPGQGALAAPAAPNNLLGVCSIQDFSGVFGNHNSDLSQTHNDARGFYTYLYNWYTANYWYIDGNVKSWLYEEPYDHWQNYYGVDAVCIFYHSGHGNMTNTGVFQAPMGGKWGTESWFFSNNKALFGNQRIRYIFWSTCLSCRVGGGLSPISTWWADDSNPGFRMLFGFETVSIDSGDYGKNFWNHWKGGESFSTAWLNASWDIYHKQSPTVVASGASQAEATNVLFNERFFSWSAIARNWYQWRWYYAASMAARNKALPKKLAVAEFAPETFSQEKVSEIAKVAGLKNPLTGMSKDGTFSAEADNKTVSLNRLGHLDIKLAGINYSSKKKLDEKEAIRIAEQHIKQHGLAAGEEVKFDMIRLGKTAGGNTKDAKKAEDEYVTDTTVQFKQIINGVPVINNNQGTIRVTIDNEGTVTNLHSSVKKVQKLNPLSKSMSIDPKSGSEAQQPVAQDAIEKSFRQQLGAYSNAKLVEDSEEVGYDINDMHGRLAVQRVYEVTMEEGLKKLIKVTVPVYE